MHGAKENEGAVRRGNAWRGGGFGGGWWDGDCALATRKVPVFAEWDAGSGNASNTLLGVRFPWWMPCTKDFASQAS